MVGGVPFFCVSSPARSAACRLCETDQGSEDFFSSPRIPPTGINDTERTPAVTKARENAIATLREPLAADMESILRKTTRLYPQNQWMHDRSKRALLRAGTKWKVYFLNSRRVRWSLFALVRNVSGIFLFVVRRFRSMGLRIGSMCKLTSIGVLGLLMRLRTTV